MDSTESSKVKWFKKELEAYLSQSNYKKSIENKLTLLTNQFDLHSKQWGTIHYATLDSDSKLANYVYKKEELENELKVLDYQAQRVEKILGFMQPWIARDLVKIFKGKKKYSDIAQELGYSETAMKKMFDLAILTAVKQYEELI